MRDVWTLRDLVSGGYRRYFGDTRESSTVELFRGLWNFLDSWLALSLKIELGRKWDPCLHNQSHVYDSFEHLGSLGLQNNIDCNCVRASIQPEPTNRNFSWNRSERHFDRNLHLGTSTIDHERPQPSRMILNHHKPPQDALWALWMFVDVAIDDGSCVEEMT